MANNSFAGQLPPEWSALAALEDLNLGRNALTGPLPPAYGGMAALRVLLLQHNTLSGALPASWSGMQMLQVILCLLLFVFLGGGACACWVCGVRRRYRRRRR